MSVELEITAPGKAHREAMLDLGAKVFAVNGSYYGCQTWCRQGYIDHSHYDWQVSRIGIYQGQVVSHFGVWDYQMRVGHAALRVAGVGLVATHGGMRKMGLMSRTATATVAAMRDAGYDLSLLFGIDNFYHRFGYVRAWAETSYHVNVGDLPETSPCRLRAFAPRHIPALAALYNATHAGLTGTAIRPTFLRCGLPQRTTGVRWHGEDGQLRGYVITSAAGNRLTYLDGAGDPEEILRALAQLARKGGHGEVQFQGLHARAALARRIRQGNCRTESLYRRNGNAMARIIHLRTTLEKLCGELSARLQRSTLASWQGALRLEGADEAVTLAIAHGQVWVAEAMDTAHVLAGGDALVQLLIGTDDPLDCIAAMNMATHGDAAQLAAALFPAQYPMLGAWDRF